jgi:predicted NAD/FAD-dependent oxidoreductase
MTENKSCLVVGAGLAGLMAATKLQQAGWSVTVLDKGRGVGGRTANRRFGGASFDHGAQYFTVRDESFQAFVDQWLADGVVKQWSNGFPNSDGESASGKYPRYVGVKAMTGMAKALAENLDVQTSAEVNQIDAENGTWKLTTEHKGTHDTNIYTADALVMTPPAEQTLRLMRSGNANLPEDALNALELIEFNPCFAVLALLDKPSQLPTPGGIFMPGEPISWMSDNQQKGISEQPAITIHAGPEFTRAHYDDDRTDVANMLIEAARDYIGDATVIDFQVQRWRYSQPAQMHPEKTLYVNTPAPVAFAGDAFNGAKVEGAVLSGMAAAEDIVLNPATKAGSILRNEANQPCSENLLSKA